MVTKDRSGNRSKRRALNNNAEGRNQYTGIVGAARANPLAAAAAVGSAVAAGAFLWSRRSQISEQIGGLSEQMRDLSGTDMTTETFMDRSDGAAHSGNRNQSEIAQEALTLKQIGETA